MEKSLSQEIIDLKLTEGQKNFVLQASIKKIDDSLRQCYRLDNDLLYQYSKQYLERGEQENSSHIKYKSNFYLGSYYFYNKSDYMATLIHADSALKAAKRLKKNDWIIRSLHLKGWAFDEQGKYEEALKNYLISLKIAKENHLFRSEIRTRVYLGKIEIRLKDYQGGKKIYTTILDLLSQEKYKKEYASPSRMKRYNETYSNVLNDLGICQRDSHENREAIITFKKGLAFLEEHIINKSGGLKAAMYTNLGKTYSNLGKYEEGMDYLVLSEKFLLEEQDKSNVYFQNILFQAEIQQKLNNVKEALEILEKGFKHLSKGEYPPKLLEMYDLAISLSQEIPDIHKENIYSRLRREVTDTIHNNDIATRTLENRELSKENEALTSENIITTTSLKSTLRLVGLLLGLLLLIMIFYFRSIRLNKRKFDALILKMEESSSDKKEVHSSYTITDEKTKMILKKLEKLELAHFFIHMNCTLHSTAKKLKTNTTYLSKIINTHKQKTFNEYLNELRIDYVLQQIKENSQFRNYTISAIAKELGYKSANTFTNAFKKQTGINPSFYIKQIEKSIPVK